jgi:hypothetical protein
MSYRISTNYAYHHIEVVLTNPRVRRTMAAMIHPWRAMPMSVRALRTDEAWAKIEPWPTAIKHQAGSPRR